MNPEWHKQHVMPRNATRAQRIEWHAEHQRQCGCRPVPASLRDAVPAAGPRTAKRQRA